MQSKTTASYKQYRCYDYLFKWITFLSAFLIIALILAFCFRLGVHAFPSIKKFGLAFLYSLDWDPQRNSFGALSSIYGTLVTTGIALIIAVPLSFVITLFLVEYAPPTVSKIVSQALDLLAAIPSIIYGMWGLFIFVPIMQNYVQPFLANIPLPFFQGSQQGLGILTAGLILALMILPYISAVMRDVFLMIPHMLKEAAFGIGATTFEVNFHVLLKYGFQGVVGAIFLGMGRALGETMAVTYVIGNNHKVSSSLFSSGNTIASTLANDFGEADGILFSVLFELSLILFVMSFLIQILTNIMLNRIKKKAGANG